jgi:hypothetical protein
MKTAPRAARTGPAAERAARAGPAAERAARAVRAAAPVAGSARAAVLAGAALAAALGIAAVLGGGSAPSRAPDVMPLRVSSGHGIATGFAVAGGRVVTVAHVLDGPVTVAGRRVRVIRVDRRNDLALLSRPRAGAAARDPGAGAAARAVAARPPEVADGERLRVVRLRDGRASMLSVHVRRSIVAHVRAPGAARALVRPALELSVAAGRGPVVPEGRGPVVPGDSGAAVVTDSGTVAGIVFAASRNRAGTAYAVDASRLRQLLRRSSVE